MLLDLVVYPNLCDFIRLRRHQSYLDTSKNHHRMELKPLYPRTAYGIANLYAYRIVANYGQTRDMLCCNGILFNHESPRRGKTFLTRILHEQSNA